MRVGEPIPGINVRQLSEVKSLYFVLKLLAWVGMIGLGWFFTLRSHGALKILPMILVAVGYAHGVELEHQALHYTGFKSKPLSRFIGFLLGLPMLVSFSDYQYHHLKHHRLLGTPENEEFFDYGSSQLTIWGFLPTLLMVEHWKAVFAYMAQALVGRSKPNIPEYNGQRIRTEYQLMALITVAAVAASFWFQTALFVELWLFPLLIATPIHALVELPEHLGCETSTTDVLQNTRSIRASWLASWYTNGNNYHVEHHWLPSVPIERLPQLHAQIADKMGFIEVSYWSFYSDVIGRIVKNTFRPQQTH